MASWEPAEIASSKSSSEGIHDLSLPSGPLAADAGSREHQGHYQ